jgi:hypothetical protein
MRRRELLPAISEAIHGAASRRGMILLNATSASDGSQLHHLSQALAAGGVPAGEVNDDE